MFTKLSATLMNHVIMYLLMTHAKTACQLNFDHKI